MGRILRSYAIREITLPTLMALLTITFILMIHNLFDLINLLLLPGVSAWQVGQVLALLLPSLIVFASPMAVLIGVLIGVGRMTMDREVLAIQSSGINLLTVFAPALGLALLLSVLIYWLSATVVPASMYREQIQLGQLKLALADGLEPQRFYDDHDLPDLEGVFYFNARDPKDGRMLGITLERDKGVSLTPAEAEKLLASATDISTSTLARDDAASSRALERLGIDEVPDEQSELTLVFAKSGRITTQQPDDTMDPTAESEIALTLENGSIHQLQAGQGQRDYVVISFDSLTKRIFSKTEIKKRRHTMNNAQLRRQIAEQLAVPRDQLDSKALKSVGELRKELWQRSNMWLATFVFALVGIPLAIWVRPSGKSWGILIAVALMLIYYVILMTGLSLVQEFKPAGYVIAILPNVLYALIGAWLWRQTLRS